MRFLLLIFFAIPQGYGFFKGFGPLPLKHLQLKSQKSHYLRFQSQMFLIREDWSKRSLYF